MPPVASVATPVKGAREDVRSSFKVPEMNTFPLEKSATAAPVPPIPTGVPEIVRAPISAISYAARPDTGTADAGVETP